MGDDREGRMDRRGFVGGLAAGAGLGIATSAAGCGAGFVGAGTRLEVEPGEVERFCARFDDGLPRIESRSPVSGALAREMLTGSREARRFAEHADPIARRALRSLHVAGAYGDLSEGARAHPHVQERMARFAPEMDASVVELKTLLATMPEEKRREIGRALRNGEPAMQIAEAIDEEARALDVSVRSRTKLRAAARHVAFRLSRQPPSLFIDEYVAKIDRVAASRGIDILAQTGAAAQVTERMFWKAQRRDVQAETQRSEGRERGQGLAAPGSAQPTSWSDLERPPQHPPEPARTSPGQGTIITGGWMLGIGAAVFAIGGVVLAAGEFAGVFVMTAGALGVIVGLVVLIIGAIISAASD